MKYEEVIYNVNGKKQKILPSKYSVNELEALDRNGDFLCSGKGCKAKLFLVHSSKNGGKTIFLKAVNDEEHSMECEYKIGNYKEHQVTVRKDGVFTEKQINDAVRRISNDYANPVKEEKNNKKTKNSTKETKSGGEGTTKVKTTAIGGRIIHGDETEGEIKGRMSRRYIVNSSDIGIMTTICGTAYSIYFDQHNDMYIQLKEERLSNILIYIGRIYQENNPSEFSSLNLVKNYFEKMSAKKDVLVAAGGLVNTQNNKLILELQSNGSLRVDNRTVMKMIVDKTKEEKKKGDK